MKNMVMMQSLFLSSQYLGGAIALQWLDHCLLDIRMLFCFRLVLDIWFAGICVYLPGVVKPGKMVWLQREISVLHQCAVLFC